MNLRNVDLNLLVVLDALIEQCSVGKAGQKLGLSQSATSHALSRLRAILGDELLVRTATGMKPTPRALRIAGPLRMALEEIETNLAPEVFDPAVERRRFVVAVETYETIVILPGLVDRMTREASSIDMVIRSGSTDSILDDIDRGQADIGIGSFGGLPGRFMARQFLQERYVCVMRPGHPLADQPLTLEQFLNAPHALVTMSGGSEDLVDRVLAEQGLRRRIAFQLPQGLAAVVALARSDMIAVVSSGAASLFSKTTPLVIREAPIAIPEVQFKLIWNRRLHKSPAHLWLRRMMAEVGEAVGRA